MAAAVEVDRLMEDASRALVRGEYLECEALCVAALAGARQARQWADYARILLPLQECRRHRRMIAAEGMVRLGTAGLPAAVDDWLEECRNGFIVVTPPHGVNEARALVVAARRRRLFVEVLLADPRPRISADAARTERDSVPGEGQWHIRSFAGPAQSFGVSRPAPPQEWINRWLARDLLDRVRTGRSDGGGPTPADWFLDAAEALGDAALAAVSAPSGSLARLEALENCLQAAGDHEILHQRLGDAVREMLLADK